MTTLWALLVASQISNVYPDFDSCARAALRMGMEIKGAKVQCVPLETLGTNPYHGRKADHK